MRLRFVIKGITQTLEPGGGAGADGQPPRETSLTSLVLVPVPDAAENAGTFVLVPSGRLELQRLRGELTEGLTLGQDVYVELTRAPATLPNGPPPDEAAKSIGGPA